MDLCIYKFTPGTIFRNKDFTVTEICLTKKIAGGTEIADVCWLLRRGTERCHLRSFYLFWSSLLQIVLWMLLVYCISPCRFSSVCGQIKIMSLINLFQNIGLSPIWALLKICCSIVGIH